MKGEKRGRAHLFNVCPAYRRCVSLVAAESVKFGGLGAVHKFSDEGNRDLQKGSALFAVCSERFLLHCCNRTKQSKMAQPSGTQLQSQHS